MRRVCTITLRHWVCIINALTTTSACCVIRPLVKIFDDHFPCWVARSRSHFHVNLYQGARCTNIHICSWEIFQKYFISQISFLPINLYFWVCKFGFIRIGQDYWPAVPTNSHIQDLGFMRNQWFSYGTAVNLWQFI